MKNVDNGLETERQPGQLAGMLGGRVEQYYALTGDVPLSGDWGSGTGKIWAEQLGVRDPQAQVLMRYGKSNGWLDGQPAAITRKVGNGSITYIGAWFDDTTMAAAAKWMVQTSGIHTLPIDLPSGVDLYIRSNGQKTVWILINFAADPTAVTLPQPMTDVLAGGSTSSVKLDQYGVAVLTKGSKD
jgi:beta-galactosidase